MWQQTKLLMIACLAGLPLVLVNSVWVATASELQQVQAQIPNLRLIQVTGVQLNPTTQGIEVVLETTAALNPETFVEENTLIADIPNAVLLLPEGEEFQATPAAGIASVSVTNLEGNFVRVAITGVNAPPTAEVTTAAQRLVLNVTPATLATEDEAIEIVVTATRTEEQVENVPRSVTVIEREEIQQQATVSRNLQDILGNLVPGFGPPTQGVNLFGQSFRGRAPQVLIDGVPIRSNLSTVQARDLRTIDPAAVERVEVVRGSSAIYGDGGTGGVINIITRQPSEEFTSTVELGVTAAAGGGDSFLLGESFGNYLEYGISGTEGNSNYLLSLSRNQNRGFFSAEGDRLPSIGVDETETLNVLGKFGVNFNDEQRLQVTFDHYDDRDNSNYISDPIVLDLPGTQTACALRQPDPDYIGRSEPRNLNTVLSLNYSHDNVFASRVQAQAYYRNNRYLSSGSDFRPFGDTNPGVSAQENEKEQFGTRLQIETPLSETLSLLWGADYADENVSIVIEGFDEAEFDSSGSRIFRKVDEFIWVPNYNFNSLGLFAQLQWNLNETWSFNGGLRYERFGLNVDDYTVLTFTEDPGQAIEGGNVNFDDVVFNLGAVYNVTNQISLFANFAQGFSAPDFGRLLRNPPDGFTSLEQDLDVTRPQQINNYELGIRGNWSNIQLSLAGFYSESDLGVTVTPSAGRLATVSREPQNIYGLEATLDWQPGAGWGLGSGLSWVEGEGENEDGKYIALNSGIIQPLKLTAYVEHETDFGWRNRLQALYVGDRDRAFEAGVDPVALGNYITLDLISSIPLAGGRLSLSVENLLNEQYVPAIWQYFAGFADTDNIPARGRTIRLGYSIEW